MGFWSWLFGTKTGGDSVAEAVQRALVRHGADIDVDNIWGEETDQALAAFKRAHGWNPRPLVGTLTAEALDSEADPAPLPEPGEPRWVTVARRYIGVREIPGPRHHPDVVRWWDLIGAGWFKDDETPWCGAFTGGALLEAGLPILPGAEAPRALAWAGYGQLLTGPVLGAVAVKKRAGGGHVGFVAGKTADGRLLILGGNQDDAVTIAPYPASAFHAWRWPPGEPLPALVGAHTLPIGEPTAARGSEA